MLLVKILSLCYHKCCMHKKTMMVSKIAEEKYKVPKNGGNSKEKATLKSMKEGVFIKVGHNRISIA